MLVVPRASARRAAALGIAAVAVLELLSAFSCREHDAASLLLSLAFLLIPLSPALVALATPNPLCSLFASAPVGAWVAYAYYQECLLAHHVSGATVYLGVWFYGFLCGVAGGVLAVPVLRLLGVRVQAGA